VERRPQRWRARLLQILSFSVLGVRLAAAAEPGFVSVPRLRANITLIGKDPAKNHVREVIAELLSRKDFAVAWSSEDDFRPQDLLGRQGEAALAAIGVWIDLVSPAKALLYFRDSQADRFFIRSLPLAHGHDEIAREEIGAIVASAVLALSQGSGQALTRSQVRAALQVQPVQDPKVLPTRVRPLRLEIVAAGGAQVFAGDLPVTGLLTLSAAVTRGPRWGRTGGAFGAWLDLGYQIPTSHQSDVVGVRLQSMLLRAGAHWEMERQRTVFRLGLGGGLERMDFQPRGNATLVDLAPGGIFYAPMACLWGGLDIRLSEHLAVATRVTVDAALMDVYFDVRDADGAKRRVLTPLALRPGASAGMAFLF
jgi:hypothetical protein